MFDISTCDEKTAYAADPLPTLDVDVRIAGEVPDTEPLPFALDHDDTRLLLGTNSSLSRCLPAQSSKDRFDTWNMPMGYTQLYLYEKRAVALAGDLLRLWPARYLRGCHLIVPTGGSGHLQLGAATPYRFAVSQAITLSRLTAGPVLLVAEVSQQTWH